MIYKILYVLFGGKRFMKKRKLKVYYRYSNNEPVSNISLIGKWLVEAGFNIGDEIEVQTVKEKIIIKKIHSVS